MIAKRLFVLIASIAGAALIAGIIASESAFAVSKPRALSPKAPSTSGWTTYGHDNSRDQYDPNAPSFTGGPFSKWTNKAVDAAIYGEPLAFNGRVYVATMANSIYAFDANTGNQVWARLALGTSGNGHCAWGSTQVGILSTPVIDPSTNIIYAVGHQTSGTERYQMYALNLSDGSNVSGFPVDLSVVPTDQNQRAALALANGHVYVAFGGWLGDCGTYHAYVVSVPTTGGAQDHIYNNSTNACQSGAGFWGPSGIAVDGSGNLYISTGNGKSCYGNTSFPCTNTSYDHSNAVIKLSSTLSELDYWTPDNAAANWCSYNAGDTDIGSVGPQLLPNGELFQTGKPGYGWLLGQSGFGSHFDSQQFQAQVSTCAPDATFGGVAYYNGRLYVPCEGGLGGIAAISVDTVAHTFISAADWTFSISPTPPIVAMGLVWEHDQGGSNLYGFDPVTGTTQVHITMSGGSNRFNSMAEDNGWIFVPHGNHLDGYDFNPPACSATTSPHWFANCTSAQYRLQNSNGATWMDMDATNLQISFTPTVNSYAILSANSSLWTDTAGYNQDLGIYVSGGAFPTVAGQPEAWKESGGPTTYSPNAAFLQTVIPVAASTAYTAKLQWKSNRADPSSIWAGAGPIGSNYSPTRISALLVPVSSATVFSKTSTSQYSQVGSDGSTWKDVDSTNLSLQFTPPSGSWLAFTSGNADLWTSSGGYNQDLGVSLSGGAYPTATGQPEAWKESGGPAAYSPNAAFVQAPLAVTGGIAYTAKLQCKANHSDPGTIWAGAGPIGGHYSPTSLAVVLVPSPSGGAGAVSTSQYSQPNSDGATWNSLDGSTLKLTLAPSVNTNYLLSANVDLWTNTIGYGQDIGIMVSGGTYGTGTLITWQESGASGAFSPNAAYAFGDLALAGGTSYTVWPVWKANRPASGVTIYAAAGPVNSHFSPTWLTATALN